jgi:hypothetical protein
VPGELTLSPRNVSVERSDRVSMSAEEQGQIALQMTIKETDNATNLVPMVGHGEARSVELGEGVGRPESGCPPGGEGASEEGAADGEQDGEQDGADACVRYEVDGDGGSAGEGPGLRETGGQFRSDGIYQGDAGEAYGYSKKGAAGSGDDGLAHDLGDDPSGGPAECLEGANLASSSGDVGHGEQTR